jgi:hypothetical protein
MLFVFATPVFRHSTQFLTFPPARCLAVACAAAAAWLFLPATDSSLLVAAQAELRGAIKPGDVRQVRAVVEVEGDLKLNPDGQKVQHVPLKAQADLQYIERVLAAPAEAASWRAVRSYSKAEATIKLRDSDLPQELRDTRRLIAIDAADGRAILFSPLGPLTREELELIETPASGIVLEWLLPGRVVKTKESWTLDDDLVVRLLGLEAVSQQDVKCSLESLDDGLAVVALEGTVAGAVGGVSSDIELKGKLNFNLEQQMVTWLTLAYREKRAVGHAQPGFEVVTKLRMIAGPASPPAELSDSSLAGLPLSGGGGQTLLDLTSESGGFQLAHDRRWRVMLERHDATVLRFVDRGDLIGQCNLSPRPPLAEGHQLTRTGFENDVKQALGKNFGQITETAEEVSGDGIRTLRVVVTGTAGELPIQWTYYHLSDNHGRRAALVFTAESSLVERYPQIDRELVAGFRFVQDREPHPAQRAPTADRSTDVVR